MRLVVLAVGVWMIFEGRLTIGGLVAFMGVMGEVLGPVGSLTGVGQQLQASTGALARVNEILEAELDVPDPADAPAMAPLSAEIRFDSTGSITVTLGTHSHGQGHETTFAQVVADLLGLEPSDVKVRYGDTDLIEHGTGSFGSRSAVACIGTTPGRPVRRLR